MTNSKFISVSACDLVSNLFGKSGHFVRDLFEMARRNKPSIIFIDGIDSLSRSDDESTVAGIIKAEFRVQMWGEFLVGFQLSSKTKLLSSTFIIKV